MKSSEIEKLLENSRRLSKAQMLSCRVRYFTDGAVIGSKKFVNDVFKHSREYFGAKRKTGARKMQGVEAIEEETMHSMRDLRKDLYGR